MIFRIITIIIAFWLIILPSHGSEIPMKKEGGVYTLPVRINRVITLDFILDSGASEVCIPTDVAMTLLRAHTIDESDFLPGKSYSLADGSVLRSERFIIRELEMGGIKMVNVPAMISPVRGSLLLGQSFLQRLDSWAIDNQRHALIIGTSSRHKGNENLQAIPTTPQMNLSISKNEVYNLIKNMFQCASVGDTDTILNNYANKVDYFNKGMVDKAFIRKDKENYYKRWQTLKYSFDGDIEIENTFEPNIIIAKFTIDFYVSNREKSIKGKAVNILKLTRVNNKLLIINEKQRVLSRTNR